MPGTALCHFRNSYFGYVVQDFALIERESVFNNIRIPLLYNKKIKRGEHKEASKMDACPFISDALC